VANDNQQHDLHQPPAPAQPPVIDAALGARGASRRRFARAGAGATGVLLTLTSQPGMACSICRSPSGYQSVMTNPTAAVSNRPKNSVTCNGWNPRQWHANLGTWKTTQFKTAFSCANKEIGDATAEMLLSLCQAPAWNQQSAVTRTQSSVLAMWLVAAYLNVQYGKSSFLKIEILQGIWREFELTKTYTPTAGVTPWKYADIIVYLSGTMD
jgi:hypothetical protein